jgi:uncharacterized protein with FMN-binding domain
MITHRFLRTSMVAVVLAIAVSTFAQRPANAPKNATAECKDGTFSSAKTQQGGCSKHGGIKTWWGADTGASPATTETRAPNEPSAKPETKSPTKAKAAAPEGATAKCKDGTYSHAKTHSGACSHHGGVAEWYK